MSDRYRRWDDEDPPPRGRASVPGGGHGRPRPQPEPVQEPPASNSDPMSLIPGPDETTLLPRIPQHFDDAPSEDIPQRRRKRAIRRHRDDSPPVTGKTRTTVRVFAELFVTFGMVVLLFAAYQIWGKTAEITNAQDELDQELEDSWAEDEDDPTLSAVPGDAVARLYMPQIRPEPWTIVEGTELADIETAPGHYEDSVMPGGQGNFAVAGHNVPAIFRHIDVLQPGDLIVVETKTTFYIYEITGNEIVKPTNIGVVAPVPNQPGVEPGEDDRHLTLTTCYPWWDNYERYIVYGELSDTRERGDSLPPEAVG
ncbi:class E sortase [Stackebrandtia soli]|uniref:class E sortase n=1 Tax=Stackebrandtia soli TaxID=1892856 RepID=UPI0039EA0157